MPRTSLNSPRDMRGCWAGLGELWPGGRSPHLPRKSFGKWLPFCLSSRSSLYVPLTRVCLAAADFRSLFLNCRWRPGVRGQSSEPLSGPSEQFRQSRDLSTLTCICVTCSAVPRGLGRWRGLAWRTGGPVLGPRWPGGSAGRGLRKSLRWLVGVNPTSSRVRVPRGRAEGSPGSSPSPQAGGSGAAGG